MKHAPHVGWLSTATFLLVCIVLPRIARTADIDIRGINFKPASPAYGGSLEDAVAEPRDDSIATLQQDADFFIAYPKVHLKVVGFTDDRECGKECIELSLRRATYVRDWLISHHVRREQIDGAEGHGSADPVADPMTEDGRARNRRVELQIVSY
jgi:outer membrane protein OmpA-like peptidoglycan-associated protein